MRRPRLNADPLGGSRASTVVQATKVLVIGGTSHVGKSTLAGQLAARLGWSYRSTDQFARHPGRPWRDDESQLPTDVVAHYSSESIDGLIDSALEHYRHNVWPVADAVVRSHLNNPFDPCLVLEGSAIIPELVGASPFAGFASVWLTAPNDLIRERILDSSQFGRRSQSEKRLIEAFVQRTLAINEIVVESTGRLGQRCLDVSSTDVLPELLCLARSE
jgi:2-phosphoglycerate kinase